MMKTKKFYSHKELHEEWMKDPKYKLEYEKSEEEFKSITTLIQIRKHAKR
ncbi:unnamed protein product [marine sediment metagenome]|uniref:Uncharacterized protein n=1 Tax=marine sediment metagenome TaxID=412755 RepID=X0T4I9_9ZZZZ